MPETDIRTLISLEADDSGVDAARKALKQAVKDQQTLIDAFKRGEKDVDSFNKELSALQKREKGLAGAIDKVTGEFTEQAAAVRELADETARLAREQDEMSTAEGRFDKVSRDVALAGDFESSLRTVGGAFGALGGEVGGAVEKIVSSISEIPAVIEALPKMKESLAGLPQAVSAAATSLGPIGLGIGAVLVVGTAIAGKFAEAQAKAQAAEEARGQALIDINIRSATGDLALSNAREELARLQDEQVGILGSIETKNEDYNEALNENGENWTRLTRLISGTEEGLFNTLTEYDERLEDNRVQQEVLIEAIESGTLATKTRAEVETDAAEAANKLEAEEMKLTAARTAGILSAAQAQAQLVALQQEALKLDEEGLELKRRSINEQKAQLQAELQALKASGDTSDAVTQRIDQLSGSLKNLDNSLGLLSSERIKSAAAANTARKEEEELAKARDETATSTRRARGAGRSIDADVVRRQIADAARGRPTRAEVTRPAADAGASINDILNAQVDLNNALADARQDTVDRLEDLQQTFRDNIDDAFIEGNFLDIAKLQKERKRSERDLLRDEQRDFREIREDGNAEILRLTQENNARRLQIEAQGMQASLNNHRQFWAAAGAISASALRLGGGRRRITAGFTGRTSFQAAPRTS